jgi:hypothetical protein
MSKFKEGDKVRIKSVEEMKRDSPKGKSWNNGIEPDEIEEIREREGICEIESSYGDGWSYLIERCYGWADHQLELVEVEEVREPKRNPMTYEAVIELAMATDNLTNKKCLLYAAIDIIDEEMDDE